jgi:hypothetical protein
VLRAVARCAAIALMVGLSFDLLLPAAFGQQAEQDVKDQAEQALEAGDMQRSAPNEESIRNEAAGVAQDPSIQHDPPQAQDPLPPPVSSPISGAFFLYLLLTVLGICLVIVAVHLVRTYAPSRRTAPRDTATDVAASPIAIAGEAGPPELDEIERLARAGKYAEAIHLMLLRTLDLLRRRLGANWARSLTSREIVRRTELGPTDRRALKVLVGAVEISRFGGHGANEQIYRNCLDHYRLIGVDLRPAGT